MNYEAITSILNDGLVLATGCTEPGALALTAAAAAAHLGEEVKSIHTFASGNIIKNAYSAGHPGNEFSRHRVCGGHRRHRCAAGKAAVRSSMASPPSSWKRPALWWTPRRSRWSLQRFRKSCTSRLRSRASTTPPKAIIANVHTNIIYIEENGKAVLDKRHEQGNADGGLLRRGHQGNPVGCQNL